eukprot:7559086-Pyramimonas_sp.AAC.1
MSCSALLFPAALTANSWTFRFHIFLLAVPSYGGLLSLKEYAQPNGAVVLESCDPTQQAHLPVRKRGAELATTAGLQNGRVADAA